MEECHRRVGQVGPEQRSSRRGRGEQRRPLRRRVGTVGAMGACPPPLRGRSAVVARNAAYPSGGPKIASHVDFDSTGSMEASRLHAAVKSEPVCGDHSACRRYMRELFRVKHCGEIPLQVERAPLLARGQGSLARSPIPIIRPAGCASQLPGPGCEATDCTPSAPSAPSAPHTGSLLGRSRPRASARRPSRRSMCGRACTPCTRAAARALTGAGSRLAAWSARPFKFLSHSAAAKRAQSAGARRHGGAVGHRRELSDPGIRARLAGAALRASALTPIARAEITREPNLDG